jgi:hypothetical protein
MTTTIDDKVPDEKLTPRARELYLALVGLADAWALVGFEDQDSLRRMDNATARARRLIKELRE